jgi:hypothetical protein
METECCCTGTREKNWDLQGGLSAKGPIAVIIQLSTCVNTGTGTARATARDAGAMPVLQLHLDRHPFLVCSVMQINHSIRALNRHHVAVIGLHCNAKGFDVRRPAPIIDIFACS